MARVVLDTNIILDYLSATRERHRDAVDLLEPIRQYDLEGVEPTFHPIGDLSNVMADDVPDTEVRHLPVDVALKNAGASRGRSFRVPSILGDQGGDR